MSQPAGRDGQPGNWEEPDFFRRPPEIARFQENGWQEPYESRGSRTELRGTGGEIPLRYPTQHPEFWSQKAAFFIYNNTLERTKTGTIGIPVFICFPDQIVRSNNEN